MIGELKIGITGLVGSSAAVVTVSFADNLYIQGGALLCFIGFLIWIIKTLKEELKTKQKEEKELQQEVRKLMRETIEKSSATNEKLAEELKTRREQRQQV